MAYDQIYLGSVTKMRKGNSELWRFIFIPQTSGKTRESLRMTFKEF